MKIRISLLSLSVLPWIAIVAAPSQTPAPAKVDFTHDVLPIFRAQCFGCHAGTQDQGGLRLDGREAIQKGGVSGLLYEVGKGRESVLVQRLLGKGGKPQMPMGFAPLSAKQVEAVVAWIDQGAAMPRAFTNKPHWAYIKPARAKLPPVKNVSWPRNPIDNFVLARLEKAGLKPAAEATRETLIRRATFDLTGLPPTLAEIDAFVADKSPRAWEKVIDRLLASPAYGERMARVWMDLSRYADTDGFEKDPIRTAWVYRDWVINAYNKNLPFDQFTVDQLAGDLLPKASVDNLVATGFHRNTMRNTEGGVDQDEAQYNVVIDRVSTTADVWLGSTMACARCHDHKYDPFTQRDFFRMAAFFSNTEFTRSGPASVGEEKTSEPVISVPTAAQQLREANLLKSLQTLEAQRKAASAGKVADWKQRLKVPAAWSPITPTKVESRGGATSTINPDGTVLMSGKSADKDIFTVQFSLDKGTWNALEVNALPDSKFVNGGPGRSTGGNFVLTGVEVRVDGKSVPLDVAATPFAQDGYSADSVLRKGSGWAIYPQPGKHHRIAFGFAKPVVLDASKQAEVLLKFESPWPQHELGKFSLRVSTEPDALRSALPSDVLAKLGTAKESEAIQALARIDVTTREIQSQIDQANTDLRNLRQSMPTAMILREKKIDGVPAAWVRRRGEFLSKESLVSADVPSFLGQIPEGFPKNRYGLAKWIVSSGNPLTARVQANRFWEMLFGRGIVATSEDFGTQSSPPSHKELLDWLAVEFMQSGWDQKHLLKTIMTSATYRQSSKVTPALIAKDPDNVLLARGPRFRLEAETIRDTSLAVSGLLVQKVGGPSVFPTQPDGIWDSPYSGDRWMTSSGEDAHRRSIYTFWKRTAPYPKFMIFDATSREACTIRRSRTNTPLQALAQLNDEGTMDASRALARRMAKADSGLRGKLEFGFRVCTGRRPSAKELERLSLLYTKLSEHYESKPDDAKKVDPDPKAAPLTMVANALLNLDETITKS